MKTIQLNGEQKAVAASTLVELLKELQLSLPVTLVEQNGVALHRHELEQALLRENDKIEILQIAAGG